MWCQDIIIPFVLQSDFKTKQNKTKITVSSSTINSECHTAS